MQTHLINQLKRYKESYVVIQQEDPVRGCMGARKLPQAYAERHRLTFRSATKETNHYFHLIVATNGIDPSWNLSAMYRLIIMGRLFHSDVKTLIL